MEGAEKSYQPSNPTATGSETTPHLSSSFYSPSSFAIRRIIFLASDNSHYLVLRKIMFESGFKIVIGNVYWPCFPFLRST